MIGKYYMRKLFIIIGILLLSGCSYIPTLPSFWDGNQSAKIIDIRVSIEALDCTKLQAPQIAAIRQDISWFILYSQGKGTRQNDVIRLVEPLRDTVNDYYKRGEGTVVYCELKRRIMITQANRAAEAVLGRF
jgi:hypothetical protein